MAECGPVGPEIKVREAGPTVVFWSAMGICVNLHIKRDKGRGCFVGLRPPRNDASLRAPLERGQSAKFLEVSLQA